MKLARPLIAALLTFAVVASALATGPTASGTAARLHQETAAVEPSLLQQHLRPGGFLPAATQQPAGQPAAPSPASEADNLFWQSIMNSTNPADFEAYLEVFPTGLFRRLAENRLAALRTTPPPGDAPPAIRSSIDFGNDTGDWAQDGECDDVRFGGDGMAAFLSPEDRGRDAADCRQLYEAGRVRLFGVDLVSGAIDFGDDASDWAQDGECDDPRFDGEGMTSILLDSDRGHDATDCRRLYDEGRIRLFGVNSVPGR